MREPADGADQHEARGDSGSGPGTPAGSHGAGLAPLLEFADPPEGAARAGHVADIEGTQHRFAPFRHGSAPVADQPAVRAAFADAARRGLVLPEKHDRPVLWLELRKLAPALSRTDPVWRLGPYGAALAGGLVAGANAFMAVRFGTRRAFAMPLVEDVLLAVAVATLAYALAVLLLRARRRTDDAVPSLLAIGRCAACGFPLRGQVDSARNAHCRCTECGAAWSAEAANRPRNSVTGSRADLPEADGLGAWRTRIALGTALRATGYDFFPDGAGNLRYIARMSAAPISNARAFAGWLASAALFELPVALVTLLAAVVVFPGCAACCVGVIVRLFLPVLDSDSAFAVAGFAALHGGALAWLAIVLARRLRGYLVRTRRLMQCRRHLRARVCPCCTMDLPPSRELRATCSCCGARWHLAGSHHSRLRTDADGA